jgi:hypothetical protein
MNTAALIVLICFDAYMWLIHIPMLVMETFA